MLLPDAFTSAARRYDFLTRLNPGYRRELRRAARQLAALLPNDVAHPVIWDLGCGTGLSTAALLEVLPDARVVGVDASAGMLSYARTKNWPQDTVFVLNRAEQLAASSAPELAVAPDGVFAAYLLRNIDSHARTRALAQIRAVMRQGTPLVLQDYSVADSRAAQLKWTLVCWGIIIPLAALTRTNTGLFTYLWRSVLDNDATAHVAKRLARAGFGRIRVSGARGWHRGVLHTYTAINQGSQA